MYSRVGGFWTFLHFQHFFDTVTASSLVRTFRVMHYKRYNIIFSRYGLHRYHKNKEFIYTVGLLYNDEFLYSCLGAFLKSM
jgi:hypothetical protein